MVAGPFQGLELPKKGDKIKVLCGKKTIFAIVQDATKMGSGFAARAAFVLGDIKGSDVHKGDTILPFP